MADVSTAFFSGVSHAQAEAEHEQNLQHSKLQQQVLKHELSRLKLQDQLDTATLQQKRADLGLGQEEGDAATGMAPSQVATAKTQGASLADALMTRSLRGFGTGTPAAPPARQPIVETPQLTSSTATAPAPALKAAGRMATPVDLTGGHAPVVLHSEDATPDTHADVGPGAGAPTDYGRPTSAAMRRAGHVWLPPIQVPELGIDVPGMWYSAKAAAEEQSRRAIALRRAEMPNQVVGAEDTLVEGGTGRPLYTNPNLRGNTPQEQYIAALKKGDTAGAKVILQGIRDSRPGTVPGGIEGLLLDARRRGDVKEANLISGVIAETAGARRDKGAEADREDQRNFTNDMRLYTADVANGWKQHADALKEYNDPIKHPENLDPSTAKEPPTYEPPSFEDWRASHGGAGAAARTGKGPAATAKTTATAKATGKATVEQASATLKGQQPGRYTLTDGTVWRVKPDGTVAAEAAAK